MVLLMVLFVIGLRKAKCISNLNVRNCKAEKNENEEVESGGSDEHVTCELRAIARSGATGG